MRRIARREALALVAGLGTATVVAACTRRGHASAAASASPNSGCHPAAPRRQSSPPAPSPIAAGSITDGPRLGQARRSVARSTAAQDRFRVRNGRAPLQSTVRCDGTTRRRSWPPPRLPTSPSPYGLPPTRASRSPYAVAGTRTPAGRPVPVWSSTCHRWPPSPSTRRTTPRGSAPARDWSTSTPPWPPRASALPAARARASASPDWHWAAASACSAGRGDSPATPYGRSTSSPPTARPVRSTRPTTPTCSGRCAAAVAAVSAPLPRSRSTSARCRR